MSNGYFRHRSEALGIGTPRETHRMEFVLFFWNMAFQEKLPEISLTILKTVKNELNSLLNHIGRVSFCHHFAFVFRLSVVRLSVFLSTFHIIF
jgi:hypothetical protein